MSPWRGESLNGEVDYGRLGSTRLQSDVDQASMVESHERESGCFDQSGQ